MTGAQPTTDDHARAALKQELDAEVQKLEKEVADFRKELVEEDTRRNIKEVLGKIVDITDQ